MEDSFCILCFSSLRVGRVGEVLVVLDGCVWGLLEVFFMVYQFLICRGMDVCLVCLVFYVLMVLKCFYVVFQEECRDGFFFLMGLGLF